jgi:uncharacterized protein YegP (UPF0339 family)
MTMARRRYGKFEIKRADDGQFYFVLKAANGQVLVTSETYRSKASAHKGIRSVLYNCRYTDKIVDMTG